MFLKIKNLNSKTFAFPLKGEFFIIFIKMPKNKNFLNEKIKTKKRKQKNF